MLLDAAMKAALVAPSQVLNITEEPSNNIKSLKDYAKEHLIQEMDSRAKRAENLRLKR